MIACDSSYGASWRGLVFPWCLTVAACGAGTPGANAHDMSVAGHHAMAAHEHSASESHASQFDPDAATAAGRCRALRADGGPLCWTSRVNPTAQHQKDAEAHARMAADHRAAAQALVDAERKSCGGVAPEDRDTSPFYQREDVVRVEPPEAGGAEPPQSVTVVFRAVDGLSLEELQLVVDCHLARNASLGHAMPEMSYCPLALKGVTADVAAGAAPGELAVTLRASDAATRGELWRRAKALLP